MSFDIIIRNGRIFDGTGNPWVRADLGIHRGKIAKVGHLTEFEGHKELDANQMAVCPGFIDIHSHSDRTIPYDPKTISTIRQGITTLVIGQCGFSPAPVNPEREDLLRKRLSHAIPPGTEFPITWQTYGEYLDAFDRSGCASNVVTVVGFMAIRIAAMGYEDRAPSSEELAQMKAYVDEAMRTGAFGMSTGLPFTPQSYATRDEVVELMKVVAKYNGRYYSHLRNEGGLIMEALNEFIDIVERSGCAGGQIAHHKVAGQSNWGLSRKTLQLIEDTNMRGINITCDVYPYNRGMDALVSVLPPWSHEGGLDALIERLKDPDIQARIKTEITEGIEGWENLIKEVGFERIFIASVKTEKWKDIEGKSIAEIATLKDKSDAFETLFELLIDERGEIASTFEMMDEAEICRIMQSRYAMIGTDGWSVAPTGVLNYGKPHPRFYGTYPRVLGKYVRQDGVLSLEDAIRRMTSFPAQQLGLFDRGVLHEGCWADVVCFDPDTVIDTATFEDPHQFPIGIIHVLVNGELVVENNHQLTALPGKILRHPA